MKTQGPVKGTHTDETWDKLNLNTKGNIDKNELNTIKEWESMSPWVPIYAAHGSHLSMIRVSLLDVLCSKL